MSETGLEHIKVGIRPAISSLIIHTTAPDLTRTQPQPSCHVPIHIIWKEMMLGGARVPVGPADFKSVGRHSDVSSVGSTPMHLRHRFRLPIN